MENNSQIKYQGNSDYFLQIISTLVKNTPNNMELGAKIRTIVNSMNNNNPQFNSSFVENNILNMDHDGKK